MSTDQDQDSDTVMKIKTWLVIDTIRRYEGKRKTIDFILREALKDKVAPGPSSPSTNRNSNHQGSNLNGYKDRIY